jgi:hypothetical protein
MKAKAPIRWLAPLVAIAALRAAPCQALNLGVDPITYEADAVAGADFTGVISVDLSPSKPDEQTFGITKHISVTVGDWDMKPDGSLVFAKPGTIPGSCAQWIDANPTEFDLSVGQNEQIRYTVHLPKTLADGTYRAIIVTKIVEAPQPGKKSIALSSAIGTILYLTVGPHVKKGKITGFTADPKEATVTLENDGSDMLRVGGTLQIDDADGKEVAKFPFGGGVALPDPKGGKRIRIFHEKYPDTLKLSPGTYTVTALLDFKGDSILGARTKLVVPNPPPPSDAKDASTAPPSSPAAPSSDPSSKPAASTDSK